MFTTSCHPFWSSPSSPWVVVTPFFFSFFKSWVVGHSPDLIVPFRSLTRTVWWPFQANITLSTHHRHLRGQQNHLRGQHKLSGVIIIISGVSVINSRVCGLYWQQLIYQRCRWSSCHWQIWLLTCDDHVGLGLDMVFSILIYWPKKCAHATFYAFLQVCGWYTGKLLPSNNMLSVFVQK